MRTRHLIVMDYFPSEKNGIARLRPTEEDVREVRDFLDAKLVERAAQYHLSGWYEGPDGIQYSLTPKQNGIVAKLEMRLDD